MVDLHQIEGDWFHVGPRLPSNYFHGCVSDFPYLISMMNREFDRQHQRWPGRTEAERALNWNLDVFRELYRVLVPGAYAGIFQGSKSYHRAAFAAELAGFEVLPMIVGITGSAMAQGGAVGKGIDREAKAEREVTGVESRWPPDSGRWGGQRATVETSGGGYGGFEAASGQRKITAPATPLAHDFDGHHSRYRDQLMPILVVMKPYEGSLARNAARWGVAGLACDAVRIPTEDRLQGGANSGRACFESQGLHRPWMDSETLRDAAAKRSRESTAKSESLGRFPGNVLLDSAGAEEVGEMSGWAEDRPGTAWQTRDYREAGQSRYAGNPGGRGATTGYNSAGTAARYFREFKYVARAPKSERMRGLETWHWIGDKDHPEGWRRVTVEEWQHIPKRRQMVGSNHPTLKSLELVRWLARLLLPPAGPEATAIRERTAGSPSRLLVPFSGVLSEAIGAALAGWADIVAIEQSPSYVEQGACRWAAWGPYSAARAESLERQGGIGKEEHHEGQKELFA